jgi:hypothetical protein
MCCNVTGKRASGIGRNVAVSGIWCGRLWELEVEELGRKKMTKRCSIEPTRHCMINSDRAVQEG